MEKNIHDSIVIREIHSEDASRFLSLCQQIDKETKYMMLEPDERQTSLEEQQAIIEQFRSSPNKTMLVAELKNHVIGFIVAIGGAFRRNRHCASVVIGIQKVWWGKGIGGRFLDTIQQWAEENCLHRLELTVRTENKRALALYERKGFIVEGVKRDSLCVDGAYVDECYMAKLISSARRSAP